MPLGPQHRPHVMQGVDGGRQVRLLQQASVQGGATMQHAEHAGGFLLTVDEGARAYDAGEAIVRAASTSDRGWSSCDKNRQLDAIGQFARDSAGPSTDLFDLFEGVIVVTGHNRQRGWI